MTHTAFSSREDLRVRSSDFLGSGVPQASSTCPSLHGLEHLLSVHHWHEHDRCQRTEDHLDAGRSATAYAWSRSRTGPVDPQQSELPNGRGRPDRRPASPSGSAPGCNVWTTRPLSRRSGAILDEDPRDLLGESVPLDHFVEAPVSDERDQGSRARLGVRRVRLAGLGLRFLLS